MNTTLAMLALLLLGADEKPATHSPPTVVPVRRAAVKAEADTPPSIVAVQSGAQGRMIAVGESQILTGTEFQFFALSNYVGAVTWDASSPDSETLPVAYFDLAPKSVVIGIRAGTALPESHTSPDGPSLAVWAIGQGRAAIAAWGVRDGKPFKVATLMISANIGPRPPPPPEPPTPPIPPTPPPVPPVPPTPPDPVPITSFRVIFVKESGTTLSAAQTAIPGAKVIRDYLFAKTTRENGVTGWREYDDGVDVTNEQPTMQSLWRVVKPKIAYVPCIAVEVNGKVVIHPYPANVTEALALFTKAGG